MTNAVNASMNAAIKSHRADVAEAKAEWVRAIKERRATVRVTAGITGNARVYETAELAAASCAPEGACSGMLVVRNVSIRNIVGEPTENVARFLAEPT